MDLDSNLKLFENTFITGNVDILGSIDIRNDLFTNKLEIDEKLTVNNFTYIDKNLNINKDLLTTNIKTNGLLDLEKNLFVEESLNTDSSLECINIDSIEFDLYFNKKKRNYLFNNNVLIYNTTNIGNYVKLPNLLLDGNLSSKNINCINANLNVINTENVKAKNMETDYTINVNNNIDLDGNLNLLGDINVTNNLNIRYASIIFKENSSFVVGQNKYDYNISYGLRTNYERDTLEAYTNDEWKSITELNTSDYRTRILFKEYDDKDAFNIDIIQNNNLTMQFNNVEQKLNIYKNVVNIYNNLNINDRLTTYNNLNIKQNLNCNNDLIINGLLNLPTDLESDGMLRYNKDKKEIEFYKDRWGYINMTNIDNGMIIDDNDSLNLYTNKDHTEGLILDNNINIIRNNLNINSNLVCTSGLEIINNMNVKNSIYFNNICELKSNINSIIGHVTPNFNNIDINNNKYLNINDEIKDPFLLNKYESELYHCKLYNNELNYVVSPEIFYNKDMTVNNHNLLYSKIYSIYDLVINKFEIYSILKNNNSVDYTKSLNVDNLYLIIIYDDLNNIIYNNTNYNKDKIILKKKVNYKIKIQKKTNLNQPVDIFIKLLGYYYNEILLENKMSKFLYKIDSIFRVETEFEKDLNLKNNVNLEKNIISNDFIINKLIIHPNINSNKSNSNILSICNNMNENIFSINENNIILGNYNNDIDKNVNRIYIKTPKNKDSLYIKGDSIIEKDINIKNDLSIKNNCILENINCDTLKIQNNLTINNNINLNNIFIKNLISENLNIYNSSEIKINKLDNIEDIDINNLKNNNIIINEKYINFNNKLYVNCENNININSDESFNLFSIGNKINPNLSIYPNGMIEMYANKLILNNIDIIEVINTIKSQII